MVDDAELLRRYVESRSEADFTALVERHFNLVYQAALRRMDGRSDLAQDAAQHVFTTLAREAPQLVSHPALVGWLFTATRYAASSLLRAERRRRERETDALVSNTLESSGPEADWSEIRGQLDEVMDKLPELDRTTILLRFFNQQAFAEIGRTFGLSEDAARKRVKRALEQLRDLLAKRGITSTASALGVMLSEHAAAAAPVGLAKVVAASALVPGATATLSASGLLTFVNTKIALTIAGTLGLIGLALHQHHQATQAEVALAVARQENDRRKTDRTTLQEQAREAEQKAADLKAELERTQTAIAALTKAQQASSAPPLLTQSQAEGLRDGKEFLARFPRARSLLLDLSRAQIHANLYGFYRTASLTAAQIEELETKTAELGIENTAVHPRGTYPLVLQLPDDELRQILGEENFQRFQEFNRARTAYEVARWVAVEAGFAATTLSQRQIEELVQTIRRSSTEYQSGQSLNIRNVDWANVNAAAQKFLTPEQWEAAQYPLLDAQLTYAIEKAQRETDSTESPKS